MNKENNNNLVTKDNGLIFKEHREFFINFFQKRDDFLSSFAEAKYDHNELKDTFLILNYLIEATSPYILTKDSKDKIDNCLKEISEILSDKSKHEDCFNKIKDLHREISTLQVRSEILPKPLRELENEQEQFWKGEESRAMREMKKAFYDVVLKY
jgi:predicted RNase H-like nuclease (RuvC/YqgF family)